MQHGVDSYSYHRFFGEIRPGESDPGLRWSQLDMLDELVRLGTDLVSLETCYFPNHDQFWDELATALDSRRLERVIAWGAPRGLKRGTDQDAGSDLMRTVELTAGAGATELRIVIGGPDDLGVEPEQDVLDRIAPILVDVLDAADSVGVSVAAETHCDLSIPALVELVERVSGRLGVVLDTANVVRIGADLVETTEVLAPHARMLHLKDIKLVDADVGNPGGWWPCVPLGKGDLELSETMSILSEAGFGGPACVEVADVPAGVDERKVVREGLDWLRNCQ